ncbi:MAG: hypothetical protein OEX77_01480 [Candidatus Bathyarchaeota archaeon]|nr:hypothetical protein [Candidatus Bathyarchaeota archaeon]MDH5732570.1 hypothetical protein [Candidatus Bathyarchaeota archaeon]
MNEDEIVNQLKEANEKLDRILTFLTQGLGQLIDLKLNAHCKQLLIEIDEKPKQKRT